MKIFIKIKSLFWPTKENNNQPLILTDKAISILILFFLLFKVFFSFEILILRQSTLFAEISAQKILELTNDLRKQYGLPPLKENDLLKKAAEEKALDMIKNKYFAHYSPTGISPWYFIEKSGYNYHYAGENLAMNFIDSEEVVKAWFNSPTHRENLLNQKYEDIGIAVLQGDLIGEGTSKIVVVQMFGSQMKKPTVALNVNKVKPPSKPPSLTPPTTFIIPLSTSSQIAKIEGEKIQEDSSFKNQTSSLNLLTTTTVVKENLPTTSVSSFQTSTPLISQVNENERLLTSKKSNREKINTFNEIVAFVLIILGTAVLIGIILNERKAVFSLVYSELVVRGALIILIGFAFLLFKMEIFLGHLVIA